MILRDKMLRHMWMQIQTYQLKEPFADIYSDDYLDPHRTTENVFA